MWWAPVSITIRAEPAPAAITLVIHMGAGAIESVVSAAVRNYGEYRGLGPDGSGVFAVSVFAVAGDITEAEIVEALPQRSFARSTIGAVTGAGFGLLATSIIDVDVDPAIAAIQNVHHDIVLPALDDPRLMTLDPLEDEALEAAAREHLAPHVVRLLALFGPRQHR